MPRREPSATQSCSIVHLRWRSRSSWPFQHPWRLHWGWLRLLGLFSRFRPRTAVSCTARWRIGKSWMSRRTLQESLASVRSSQRVLESLGMNLWVQSRLSQALSRCFLSSTRLARCFGKRISNFLQPFEWISVQDQEDLSRSHFCTLHHIHRKNYIRPSPSHPFLPCRTFRPRKMIRTLQNYSRKENMIETAGASCSVEGGAVAKRLTESSGLFLED